MSVSDSHIYSPLNPNKREVRLLTILPERNGESPVRCTLQTASLDNPPKFEALSYVWGDALATVGIIVHDLPFNVTTNLGAALRSLRYPRKQRTMWIDFICIDQRNIGEKNTQLPLMGQIYKVASSVIAWLGPLTPNREQTISMIKRNPSNQTTFAGMLWKMRQAKSIFSPQTRRQMVMSVLSAFDGYLDLISSPYWMRIWTFQEYYLPKNEPVCMCGNLTFSLPALVELTHHFHGLLLPFMGNTELLAPKRDNGTDIIDHREFSHRVHEMRQRQPEFPAQSFAHDIATGRKNHWTFADVLQVTAQRQCSNPIDRFYALYAMVPGVQAVYPVDYEKTVYVAMLQTTIYILVYESADWVFNIFHFYDGPPGNVLDAPLPSWVPDYHNSAIRAGFDYLSGRIDSSLEDGGMEDKTTNLSLEPFKYILHFWARRVGRCSVAFRFGLEVPEIVTQIMSVINETGQTWINASDHPNIARRFAKACFAHKTNLKEYSVDNIVEGLTQLRQWFCEGKDDATKPQSRCSQVLKKNLPALAGRTVFSLTDSPSGGFGIGVGALENGDLLILSGRMVVPVALRGCDTQVIDSDQMQYKMIGVAFVEDIYGDQRENPTPLLAELKERSFEKFLIF